MATKWLNNFVDVQGEWLSGQPPFLQYIVSGAFGNSNVQIQETSASGSALIFASNCLTAAIPEVFLNIHYSNGSSVYLSAPVKNGIQLTAVKQIDLVLLVPVAVQGAAKAGYNIFVNAHCAYD